VGTAITRSRIIDLSNSENTDNMPNKARPLGTVSTRHEVHAETPFSAMAVRPPGIWRYNVEALHPICRATSAVVMVPDASIAFAALTLMASNAGGRPPTRPRARLAARAVRVRSRKSSTSNCPRAAKMCRINRPVALVVSMFSWSADATCRQDVHRGQKLTHGSRQTIEPGDDQHIVLAGEFQGGGKLRVIGARVPLIDSLNTRSHPAAWRASI
jgi:hypothetical protein